MRLKNTISHRDLKKIYSPICKSISSKQKSISPPRIKPLTVQKRSESTPRTIAVFATSRFQKERKSEHEQPKSQTLTAWNTSNGHGTNSKVFIIQGSYPDLKKTLLDRGWVENSDCNSKNFNLFWASTAKVPPNLQDWQVINHFPRNVEISAKWNFCENIKKANTSKSKFMLFLS